MFSRPTICTFGIALLSAVPLRADPAGADFFEKKVRPLLEQRCLECHSPEKKVKGGLRLDTREGWAKGGDAGPAVIPGDLDKSLLIEAVRYKNKDLQMPEKRKLPDAEIAILEEWVKMGAPDPRTGGSVAKKQTGLSIEEGKRFWSYIPPKKVAPPAVKDTAWPRGDIDRFILAEMEKKGVQPAPDASPAALVRRITYNLIGLPPTPEQMEAFEKSVKVNPQSAVEQL
ncbi:MAG: c-type cytochrome domain-containing protein, partial [Chthoniobacteraceae bacterium]